MRLPNLFSFIFKTPHRPDTSILKKTQIALARTSPPELPVNQPVKVNSHVTLRFDFSISDPGGVPPTVPPEHKKTPA